MVIRTSNFKEQEEEAKLYPELNQGLEVLNEAGEWVIGREKEQFLAYARGFLVSGIIGELNGNAVKVLNVIAGFTNQFRNTTTTDKKIMKYAGISCLTTLHRALRELKFYRLISSHFLPGGSLTKRRRCIVLSRWDIAKAILVKEKKIIIDSEGQVIFLIPNPYRKK